MAIRYYLTLFPMEALIASQHEAEEFGLYMATGSRSGSSERLIFVEVTPGFDGIDWAFAEANCVPHSDGRKKNSVYLKIYRVLETVPLDAMGTLYLTTRDGRTLGLSKTDCARPAASASPYHVYQELCPVNPLVVSRLSPHEFACYITNSSNRLFVPKLAFADLKVVNFDDPENTGNIGALYDRNIRHLRRCIDSVMDAENEKLSKTLERSHVESFSFNIIRAGIYICDGASTVMYAMPDGEQIRNDHYDWGRSALIL